MIRTESQSFIEFLQLVAKSASGLIKGAIAFLLAFVFFKSLRIGADYFDAYHLLLNAKAITEGGGLYDFHRFILAPLIHVPSFWLAGGKNTELIFKVAHLWGAIYFIALAWASFRLYRLHFGELFSLSAVALLLTTPLLLHYSVSAKEDIPALFYFTLSLGAYLTSLRSRFPFWCALITALTIGHRYNTAAILPPLYFVFECFNLNQRRSVVLWRAFTLLLLPLILLALVPLILYPLLGRATVADALPVFWNELVIQYLQNSAAKKESYLTVVFLIRLVGFPALILMGWALVCPLGRSIPLKLTPRIFHGVVLTWIMIVQTVFVLSREGRYLFLLLPSLFALVMMGIEQLLSRSDIRKWLSYSFTAMVVLLALYRGVREGFKLNDPFYETPFAQDLSRKVVSLTEGRGRIVWAGNYYGTHPKDYFFDANDDFAYLYHVYTHVIQFYVGKEIALLDSGSVVGRGNWEKGLILLGAGEALQNSDVLIINSDPRIVTTRTATSQAPPLYIKRVKFYGKEEYEKRRESIVAPAEIYESDGTGKRRWKRIIEVLPQQLSEGEEIMTFDVIERAYFNRH